MMEDSGRLVITKDYTTTPDVYFDTLMRTLSDGEWKVLSVIIRKTIGFGKFSDKIAMSQILDMTGYTQRKSVLRVRASLAEKGLISFTKSHGGSSDNCTEYTIVLPAGVSFRHGVDETRVSKTSDTGVLNAMTRVSETTPTIDNSFNRQSTTDTARERMDYGMIPKELIEPIKRYVKATKFKPNIGYIATHITIAVGRTSLETVRDAINNVAAEAEKPGCNLTYIPRLSNLLTDSAKLIERAAESQTRQDMWWTGLSETAIIDRIASLLRYQIEVPQEVAKWIPQAQQILNARLAV